MIKLGPWIYKDSKHAPNGRMIINQRFIRWKTDGSMRVAVGFVVRGYDFCWRDESPYMTNKFKVDKSEIPLRLLFEIDLWLFENGHELEDLFVFPEIGANL